MRPEVPNGTSAPVVHTCKKQVSKGCRRKCDFSTITQMSPLTFGSRFCSLHRCACAFGALPNARHELGIIASKHHHWLLPCRHQNCHHWLLENWTSKENSLCHPPCFHTQLSGRDGRVLRTTKNTPEPKCYRNESLLSFSTLRCQYAGSTLIAINKFLSLCYHFADKCWWSQILAVLCKNTVAVTKK